MGAGTIFGNHGFSWASFPILSFVKWIATRWEIWGFIKDENCKRQLYLLFPPIKLSRLGTPVPNGFRSQEEIICTRRSPQGPFYWVQITDVPPSGLLPEVWFLWHTCLLGVNLFTQDWAGNQWFSALTVHENHLGCFYRCACAETSLPEGSGWSPGSIFFFFFFNFPGESDVQARLTATGWGELSRSFQLYLVGFWGFQVLNGTMTSQPWDILTVYMTSISF